MMTERRPWLAALLSLVARGRIFGSPALIYYSYDPFGWKPLPAFTAVRWERIGMSLEK